MFLLQKPRLTTVAWLLAMVSTTISFAFAQSESRTGTSQPQRAAEGSASNHQAVGPSSRQAATPVGLHGHCPVCLVEMKQWIKGDPQFAVEYDGQMYYFPGTEQAEMFKRDPKKYLPVLGGDDVVRFFRTDERVAGKLDQGLSHEGRLYFFASAENKHLFQSSPESYAAADLALDGECIVCRVGMNQHVAGNPEHTVTYKGLRYQFPADEQKQTFLASPARFVDALAAPAANGASSSGTRPSTAPRQQQTGSGSH